MSFTLNCAQVVSTILLEIQLCESLHARARVGVCMCVRDVFACGGVCALCMGHWRMVRVYGSFIIDERAGRFL